MHTRGAVEIRVRGRVQGVGFRPTVWRMAQACGLDGDVRNDADGVLVRLAGAAPCIDAFRQMLQHDAPPLAEIDTIDVRPLQLELPRGFAIVESLPGAAHTQVSPDARVCDACAAEILDPSARRYLPTGGLAWRCAGDARALAKSLCADCDRNRLESIARRLPEP